MTDEPLALLGTTQSDPSDNGHLDDSDGKRISVYVFSSEPNIPAEDRPLENPEAHCPWCDDRLPACPSQELLDMMAVVRSRSLARPSRHNPNGLYVSFPAMASVCYLHAEELDRERNPSMYGPPPCRWPSAIDWKVFIGRAFSLGDKLQSIVDDIDERWQDSFSSRKSLRSFQEEPKQFLVHPRTESYFWKAITNDILVHGRKYPEIPDGTLVILSRARPG